MRTKSEIIEQFKQSLSTPEWKKLLNGVIGRELLAIGAEIVLASEQVKSSMIQMLDPNQADKGALLSLAMANEVALELSEPSWIQVKIEGGSSVKIIAPFALRVTIGSVLFTNITYYRESDTITLYQGVVKSKLTLDSTTRSTLNFLSYYDSGVTERLDVENLLVNNQVLTFYRAANMMLDSVYLIKANDGRPKIISKYNPFFYRECYKLMNLSDGTNILLLADGDPEIGTESWGIAPRGNDYQLIYLEKTNLEFDANVDKMFCYEYSVNESKWISTKYVKEKQGNDSSKLFTVLASYQGSSDSLAYARRVYEFEMLSRSALLNKSDIETAIKSIPYVQDTVVEVVAGTTVTINVKVLNKDLNAETTDYAEIASLLIERSIPGALILFPEVSVTEITKTISLTNPTQTISQVLKGTIRSEILSWAAYKNVTFTNYVQFVRASDIEAFVRNNFDLDVKVSADTTVTEVTLLKDIQWT